ncbi:MAG: hypothetical protein JWN32_727 [Solirubrobacterales bacterium]|nr:hypothetical protein [Solirubrobacterales bacterium]
MPTPTPAASATGSTSAGAAAQPAIGVTATAATSIEAARPSMPPSVAFRDTRWPSTMYSVNSAALAKANANPSAWPASRTSVSA